MNTASLTEDEIELADRQRWVSFALDGQLYGVDVMKVQEVLCMPSIAPVPGTPTMCLGVINLRGHIVPVVDLRRLLGLAEQADSDDTRLVIVDDKNESVAFRVDRVGDVVNLSPEAIDSAPPVGNVTRPEQVRGVVRRDGELLILLEAPALLRAAASHF